MSLGASVAALASPSRDQHLERAGFAQFAEGDFCGCVGIVVCPEGDP